MTAVAEQDEILVPESDKALIHFLRPSSFGGAIQATLYDGVVDYIGTISANTRVSYEAAPGEHRFMVIGESADFLQAELLEDKVYFATVEPRIGVWKARFSLRPMNGQVPQEEIDEWMEGTKQVIVDEDGIAWAEQHQEDILKKREKYLAKWHEKPDSGKQILHADSGQ